MAIDSAIFITGAASGIGRETALLFAARGWFVGLADIDQAGLQALAAIIGAEHCHVCVLDVTDPPAYQRSLTAFAARTGGRLRVLFNNAGILRMGLNDTIALEQQHLTMAINVNAVLTGIHYALPLLRRTPQARIITMCSTSAVYGMPELAVYSASKHAIRGLTEALGLELERDGIVVSDIIAPYINTPMVNGAARLARSVATTGVNLQPVQLAELVWKAAHGKRVHWRIHYLTYALAFVFWALPFIRRPLVRRLCLAPPPR